jgi:hypothetical protein
MKNFPEIDPEEIGKTHHLVLVPDSVDSPIKIIVRP